MTEVSSIMAKICNINFWIENDPPPLWNFSENSSVLEGECVPKNPWSTWTKEEQGGPRRSTWTKEEQVDQGPGGPRRTKEVHVDQGGPRRSSTKVHRVVGWELSPKE